MTSREPAVIAPIVLVVSLSADAGGAERSMLTLLSHLEAEGWHPVLACPQGQTAQRARALGLCVHPVAWRPIRPVSKATGRPGAKRYPLFSVLAAVVASAHNTIGLARMVRRERAALILSNSSAAHLLVTAAGLVVGRPVVWHLRDIVRPGPGRRVLQVAARATARVIAISDCVARTLPGTRVVVVGNPVMLDWSRTLPGAERPVTVGFLGRLDPEKGVHTLVQAMSKVPAPLLVFGERAFGPAGYVEQLEALVAASAAHIQLRGRVEHPEDALAQIDVLAVPSALEPWGRVAAEALSSGIPVVASSTGGLPGVVRDGVDGLLVPPGDVTAWEHALRRMVTDDRLRARLSQSASEGAYRFSAASHARDVARVLDEARRRGP